MKNKPSIGKVRRIGRLKTVTSHARFGKRGTRSLVGADVVKEKDTRRGVGGSSQWGKKKAVKGQRQSDAPSASVRKGAASAYDRDKNRLEAQGEKKQDRAFFGVRTEGEPTDAGMQRRGEQAPENPPGGWTTKWPREIVA